MASARRETIPYALALMPTKAHSAAGETQVLQPAKPDPAANGADREATASAAKLAADARAKPPANGVLPRSNSSGKAPAPATNMRRVSRAAASPRPSPADGGKQAPAAARRPSALATAVTGGSSTAGARGVQETAASGQWRRGTAKARRVIINAARSGAAASPAAPKPMASPPGAPRPPRSGGTGGAAAPRKAAAAAGKGASSRGAAAQAAPSAAPAAKVAKPRESVEFVEVRRASGTSNTCCASCSNSQAAAALNISGRCKAACMLTVCGLCVRVTHQGVPRCVGC